MPRHKPEWALENFSETQVKTLESKISEIESHTRGEVVVVIAEASATVGHVPYAIFISLLFIFTLVDLPHVQASFTGDLWWPLLLWPVAALFFTRLLSSNKKIQRLFTPKDDLLKQVEARAEVEFYRHNLQKTDGSTGVLIFVSMLEHQAVVLGDKSISDKLPPETWSKIIADLMGEARKGDVPGGLMKALDDISPILQQHFPASGKNPNELPNHLIFVDA